MQTESFAPSHPHANLQPFEPIKTMDALAIDPPAFTSQKNVDAQVTEAGSTQRYLAHAHAQSRPIGCRALAIPPRPTEPAEPTRPHTTDLEPLVDPPSEFLAT
jgi:hypothetical protein